MTTPKQRNERLLQVVRVLKELPKEKVFSLGRWYSCGTVGCACGWSANDPWFTKRGFHLDNTSYSVLRPVFRNNTGWRAVEQFFGVGDEAAERMFSSDFYKRGSKYDVIRRIEKCVRDNPA